jgi:long-subunit acyl-CoA synthetase (AMP-forming)
VLAFRPLADPTDRCTTLYSALTSGATLVLPESRSEVASAMYEAAPTFVHVTRRWVDETTTTIWARLESSRGVKGLFARRWLRRLTSGRPLSGPFATTLARYPIIEKLGLDSARVLIVSGSALGVPERRFASALRLPIRPAYALTEAGGVLAVADDLSGEPGACGRPLPGVALSVDAAGLVHLRDEESGVTLDTLDSGELRDGALVLKGRRSDRPGSSPEALAESLELEVALRGSLFVREAVVDATASGTTVIVEPIFATLERWAQNRGIPFATVRSLVRADAVIEHLRDEVLRAGAAHGLGSVDRLVVLDESLEAIPGALSSSGRVRREVVAAVADALATA